jgi:insertion element IS1 protein InsB
LDQKKVAQLPPFHSTLLSPDPADPMATTLELDELWSFVLKKAHDSWIWIALCRKTRQVVSYAIGDRSKKTCQRLWEAIPESYRTGQCFTDFWATYQAVIPEEQHTAVGKETGETAHVERWNNTLRQRLARFVRMTLSFSKSIRMHEVCLLLFLHRYNEERGASRLRASLLIWEKISSCGQNGRDVGVGCYSSARRGRFLRFLCPPLRAALQGLLLGMLPRNP